MRCWNWLMCWTNPTGDRDWAGLLFTGPTWGAPCRSPWALHVATVPENWREIECVVPLNLGRAETCRLKLGTSRWKEQGGRELWGSIRGEICFPFMHASLGTGQNLFSFYIFRILLNIFFFFPLFFLWKLLVRYQLLKPPQKKMNGKAAWWFIFVKRHD